MTLYFTAKYIATANWCTSTKGSKRCHKTVYQSCSRYVPTRRAASLWTSCTTTHAAGDPTTFGNFKIAQSCTDAVCRAAQSYKANGYGPSVGMSNQHVQNGNIILSAHLTYHTLGMQKAREAVARRYSHPKAPVIAADVVLAHGCSNALDLCISILANSGQNILVPAPGFSLYVSMIENKGIEARHYPLNVGSTIACSMCFLLSLTHFSLQPNQNWNVDIEKLEQLINDKTSCNYHQQVWYNVSLLAINYIITRSIIAIARPTRAARSTRRITFRGIPYLSGVRHSSDRRWNLPRLDFWRSSFYPMASLAETLPVLAVGGLAKQWLVPGWRVGWVLIHTTGITLLRR